MQREKQSDDDNGAEGDQLSSRNCSLLARETKTTPVRVKKTFVELTRVYSNEGFLFAAEAISRFAVDRVFNGALARNEISHR